MNNTLTVGGIVQNGFLTGLKNATSLLGAVGLWVVTLWIPYLNVGTTIGLLGLIAAMSKGEVISPTAIFRPEYRKQMGEFFLVQAFISVGVAIGTLFFVIPGVVIALAWSLAPLLVIDQSMNPTEALQKSNNLTTGKKGTMFFGVLLTNVSVYAVVLFVATLFGRIHYLLGGLFGLAGLVVVISVAMGAQAHIYGILTGSAPPSERPVNNGMMIGGAIGATVLSFILVAVINSIGRPSYEDRYGKYESNYRYKPAAAETNYGGVDMSDPAPSRAKVAPSLAEEAKPKTKDVAAAKQRRRK